jgi:hypothetical protein
MLTHSKVALVMSSEAGMMLGVQATRNAGMAASYFGSTGLTVAFFVGKLLF